MSSADTIATWTLSRRRLLVLGGALALPAGCVHPRFLRDVNLDTLDPGEVLLLGRVRVTALDEERTGDAFLRTNLSDDELLLPPDGQVAWVVRCPVGRSIQLRDVNFSHGWLSGGLFLLAPAEIRAPIVYFGTIHLEMIRGLTSNREHPRAGQLGRYVVDEHDADMAAFVTQNPRLAGRRYYNVLRGAFFQAPVPGSASPPSAPG